MIRKSVLLIAAAVALLLGTLAAPASADPDPTPESTPSVCYTVGYNNCVAYPTGGFGDAGAAAKPTATPTPRPFATATPDPATSAAAAAAAPDAAQIAFTGAESRVLGYVGVGFIGFGAVALAAARRKHEADNN